MYSSCRRFCYPNPPRALPSTREMNTGNPLSLSRTLCPALLFLCLLVLVLKLTRRHQIIDKRAALIILKRLIQDMMEAGEEATEARRVGEKYGETRASPRRCLRRRRRDQEDDDSTQNSGGFFLDRGSSEGDPDASVDGGGREGTSEGDEQLRVDTQHEGGGGNAGVGPDEGLISSPRKKQRLRNLRLAKGMERAREKDIAVVGCWIPSVP